MSVDLILGISELKPPLVFLVKRAVELSVRDKALGTTLNSSVWRTLSLSYVLTLAYNWRASTCTRHCLLGR